MASFTQLANAIKAAIKQNGVQDISGQVLQNALLAVINVVEERFGSTLTENAADLKYALKDAVGSLSNLTTEQKTCLVDAINENVTKLATIGQKVGEIENMSKSIGVLGITTSETLAKTITSSRYNAKYDTEILVGRIIKLSWTGCNATDVVYTANADNVKIENVITTTQESGEVTFTASKIASKLIFHTSGETGAEWNVYNITYASSVINSLSNSVQTNTQSLTNQAVQITSLKTKLDGLSKSYSITDLTKGYYRISGGIGTSAAAAISSSESFYTTKLSVKAGLTYYLSTNGGNDARAYALTDTDNIIYQVANANTTVRDAKIDVEKNGYLYVNCKSSSVQEFSLTTDFKSEYTVFKNDVVELNEDTKKRIDERTLNEVIYTREDFYKTSDSDSYYYNVDGGIGTVIPTNPSKGSSTSAFGCIKIELKKGTQVTIATIGSSGSARAYALADTTGVIYDVAVGAADYRDTNKILNVTQNSILIVNCTKNTEEKFFVKCVVNISSRIGLVEETVTSVVEEVAQVGETALAYARVKFNNPKCDLKKQNLKILDIGNSYSAGAFNYVKSMMLNMNIDISDICVYQLMRGGSSFRDWYNVYNGTDSKEYEFRKYFGGLIADTEVGTAAVGDNSKIIEVLQEKWDIIFIHQTSTYSHDFSLWEKSSGNGGYLQELLRVLRYYQPQASIATYLCHSSYFQSENGDTAARWRKIAQSASVFASKYNIDIIIPYGTACENIRTSSVNTTTNGMTADGHHMADGVGNWVCGATTYQALFAPRYGISIAKCTYKPTVSSSTATEVTEENLPILRKAVISAVCDWYSINNPDNI